MCTNCHAVSETLLKSLPGAEVAEDASTIKIEEDKAGAFRVVLLRVDAIPNPHSKTSHVEGWINSGFTKLRLWQLTVFDKVSHACRPVDNTLIAL